MIKLCIYVLEVNEYQIQTKYELNRIIIMITFTNIFPLIIVAAMIYIGGMYIWIENKKR